MTCPRRSVLAAGLLLLASVANAAPAPSAIGRALADPARPAGERATDAVRKPAETLAFAGVKPGMRVLEFYPGGGYFTRLLSALVGPKGHVYAVENARWKSDKVTAATMSAPGLANVDLDVRPSGAFSTPVPVDLAWVTQNYHDLKIAKYGVVDTLDFDRRVFAALKPGGVFMIVDHQANPGTTEAAIADLHRIEKAQVIREVTAAGFRLAAEGKFLAQAADDHTRSIFDKAIQNKTDQYALKFVKPAR